MALHVSLEAISVKHRIKVCGGMFLFNLAR